LRIIGIDYGGTRTGIAVTDPLQIISSPLTTIDTRLLMEFLTKYLSENEVETLVMGYPLHKDGNPTYLTPQIDEFLKQFSQLFPTIKVVKQDEYLTSHIAKGYVLQSGAKKEKRKDKSLVDKIAASILIEDYMKSVGKWF